MLTVLDSVSQHRYVLFHLFLTNILFSCGILKYFSQISIFNDFIYKINYCIK